MVATECLKKNIVSVLEWLENLWTIMKDKVAYKQPLSAEDQAIKEVRVTEVSQEYCESLISSMPRSIQAVIDSKGGHSNTEK